MIGVFDSGFGGLTILKSIREELPEYDYLYLGDNARTPYGTRSFEVVYAYTLQAVKYLFDHGCNLVILACNTASAKALRNIQQRDLPQIWEQDGHQNKRVLGVIRPTVEVAADCSQTKHVGILATPGTVASESYVLELQKQNPLVKVTQQACPMWVPLIENNEHQSEGADYFIEKYIQLLLSKDQKIDTILLACTHYPLLLEKIRKYTQETAKRMNIQQEIKIVPQGAIVAESLADYLQRHPEIEIGCTKNGSCHYLTTESTEKFRDSAAIFLGENNLTAEHIELV